MSRIIEDAPAGTRYCNGACGDYTADRPVQEHLEENGGPDDLCSNENACDTCGQCRDCSTYPEA